MIVNEDGAIVLKNTAVDRLYPDVNFLRFRTLGH